MNGRDVDPVEVLGFLGDLDDDLLGLRHVTRTTNFNVSTGNDDA